jgi:hypothetical protein
LGFILGSAAAITFALVGTAVVFFVLRAEYPQLGAELEPLLISVALFALLTVAAGLSFYAEIKAREWRGFALAVLAAALTFVAYYVWPRP